MRRRALPIIAFPTVAFVLSLATSSVSAELGVANVAVGLAVLTTLAGLTSWQTGLITSTVSALSLNYFHTRPVHSLRIGSSSDVLLVTLLGGIGVTVSASTALRTRRRVLALESSARQESAEALADLLRVSAPAATTWHTAVDASDHALRLTVLSLEPTTGSRLDAPVVARLSWITPDGNDERSEVLLPETGALVDFRDPRLGQRLRIAPTNDVGPLVVDRSTLFQLVDTVESVLTRSFNGTKQRPAD